MITYDIKCPLCRKYLNVDLVPIVEINSVNTDIPYVVRQRVFSCKCGYELIKEYNRTISETIPD